MSAAGRWAAALGASLLANAALGGTVWLAVRPDPLPPPEPFAARVSVETRAVTEARVLERDSGGAALREASAPAARTGTATLRESRAAPASPPSEPVQAVPAPAPVADAPLSGAGPALAATGTAGERSTSAPLAAPRAAEAAPSASSLDADAARPTPVAASVARPDPAPPSDVPAVPVGTMRVPNEMARPSRPAGPAITTSEAAAPVAAAFRPETSAATALRPRAALAPEAVPQSEAASAALAAAAPVPSAAAASAAARAAPAPVAPRPAPTLAVEGAPAAAAPLTASGVGASEPPALPAPQAVPASAPASADVPRGDPASAASPSGERAPPAAATGAPAPELPPPSERGTARLAWESDALAADPLSLAAAQSFMRAAAPEAGADPVRDGLAAALAAPPCSRLQTRYDPDTGTLELRGHVPEEGMRGALLAALAGEIGGGIPVADRMRVLPRPVCGALAGIASIGLPQSTEQDTDPRIVGPDTHVRAYDYRDGERLVLDLAGPDYDAFVYVDYFAADGTVIHLEPNDTVPLRRVAADEPFRVGEAAPGRAALDLIVAPPFGQEIAAAFAASRPLYEGTRPVVEPAGPYLDFLRERVAAARAADPGFKGEWVYVFVATGP